MNWFDKLSGIPSDNLLQTSVPKDKLITNIKSGALKNSMIRELDNVQEIIYHAIFRHTVSDEYAAELHIIEIKLFTPRYVKVIAEAFQKAIPYEKVIVFSSGEKYLLFHDHGQDFPISQYQFSDWVYEEELLIDPDFRTAQQPLADVATDDFESWINYPDQLSDLFRASQSSSFICLRRLIDILKIREINSGRSYVHSIVTQLVSEDRIEYFDEMPFVLQTDADQQYLRRNPNKFSWEHVEDRRFGIDRQFEPLTVGDLTTQSDVLELLADVESAALRPEWEDSTYDTDDFDDYE